MVEKKLKGLKKIYTFDFENQTHMLNDERQVQPCAAVHLASMLSQLITTKVRVRAVAICSLKIHQASTKAQ